MRTYKFNFDHDGNIEALLPISDGHSFIFSFSASAYKRAKSIGIGLYCNTQREYEATLTPSKANRSEEICLRQYPNVVSPMPDVHADGNIVVRVNKTFPRLFTTYINNHLISTTGPIRGTSNDENRVEKAGFAIDTEGAVTVTLNVFDYTEFRHGQAFAQAMRNLDSTDLETENEERQVWEKREKQLSADGADRVDSSSVSDTVSADASWMRYSSTVAWPTAVELVADDSVMNTVKVAHDRLMCAWVVQRGGNTSLSTYDYFAHSHRAAWPAAVAGYKFDKILKRVQERHGRLMMLVPLAKAEASS